MVTTLTAIGFLPALFRLFMSNLHQKLKAIATELVVCYVCPSTGVSHLPASALRVHVRCLCLRPCLC